MADRGQIESLFADLVKLTDEYARALAESARARAEYERAQSDLARARGNLSLSQGRLAEISAQREGLIERIQATVAAVARALKETDSSSDEPGSLPPAQAHFSVPFVPDALAATARWLTSLPPPPRETRLPDAMQTTLDAVRQLGEASADQLKERLGLPTLGAARVRLTRATQMGLLERASPGTYRATSPSTASGSQEVKKENE